jgi:penicillin-binding protein 1A
VAAAYAVQYEPGEQAMSPETAFIVTDLLRGVVREGTGAPAQKLGKPAAGKTGTTNDSYDTWFAGFTRDLVTVVWLGYDLNPHPLGRFETGGRASLPIWLEYMRRALDGRPQSEFYPPEWMEVRRLGIDADTGRIASSGSKKVLDMWFRKGTEPQEVQSEKGVVNPEEFNLGQLPNRGPPLPRALPAPAAPGARVAACRGRAPRR